MTMPRGASRALYAGNGQAAEFPFFFKVFEADQLSVLVTSPTGATSEAAGWTVELDEGGGTVRYLHNGAPLPEGWKLAIMRDMPFVQEVDLITGTRFDPEVIETALDVATAERQQLLERLDRAIVVEPTDEAGPEALLADIRDARTSATASATSAAANANAAANSAQSAAGSAAIATEEREAACICAGEAKDARDVAIAQTEAANILMEAELAKVNAIVAANKTDQQAAVTAARQWAEKDPDTPVDYDEDGNPRYSARHWAENAQKIAMEPPTPERRGGIRVGAGLRLETGENGETDVLAVAADELGGRLLFNADQWLTESGTFISQVDSWYSVWLIDGGGGAAIATLNNQARGGWSGAFGVHLVYLEAGQEVPVTIGAGGPGTVDTYGTLTAGGETSFAGLKAFPESRIPAAITGAASGGYASEPGMGPGGAMYNWPGMDGTQGSGRWYGAGGAACVGPSLQVAGNGAQGAVYLRWHDPARAVAAAPSEPGHALEPQDAEEV